MALGHFIWTDLSTYYKGWAKRDYAALFGWRFDRWSRYAFASLNGQYVAAAFPMPKRLAAINMPSFWMSYVHVEDVDATVAKARAHEGAIIEVEPEAFDKESRIALIRDPSGAGFTVYEGPEIATPASGVGTVMDRYYHGPDIGLIENFYADLFDWKFTRTADTPWPQYAITCTDGTQVAIAEEVPEEISGKFRYWMPCFQAGTKDEFLQKLARVKGTVSRDLTEARAIIADRQQAHFMVAFEN